jgi:hypothetical protein
MHCARCGRDHPTESCNRSLVFQGYVFAPPYLCMCCGVHIDPKRWVANHTCEPCEWGACATQQPPHRKPAWLDTSDGTEAFELYVEYVEAIPRSRY